MNFRPGPDPTFPYLSVKDRYTFPPPEKWDDNIVAVGGNLSPGMLLSAYEQGIFPWYNPEDPVLWQSPDPRCVIFPDSLHISESMRKVFKKGEFEIALDRDFAGLIRACAETERPGQGGTWITEDIITAYVEMHRLGFAHSVEAYSPPFDPDGGGGEELVGGCYGVLLGKAFFGESMFSRKRNASKAAFLSLAQFLFENDVAFIDCQVPTDHLRSLGGVEMSRSEFLKLLKNTLLIK
jgi:leucyl/phenylalanyl-tRNA--protein transferase